MMRVCGTKRKILCVDSVGQRVAPLEQTGNNDVVHVCDINRNKDLVWDRRINVLCRGSNRRQRYCVM